MDKKEYLVITGSSKKRGGGAAVRLSKNGRGGLARIKRIGNILFFPCWGSSLSAWKVIGGKSGLGDA